MKKILLSLICTGLLFGANYETYSELETITAEKAKIVGYKKIINSLNDNSLKNIVDSKKYFDNIDTYFSNKYSDDEIKEYISLVSNPLFLEIQKNIKSDFSYDDSSSDYISYLKNFKKNLPKKERMELVRDIVLESADVSLFLKTFKKLLPESVIENKSTFQKNIYFENVKKKALKYFILRMLFVTKDKSIDDLKKYLNFIQSSKYKRFSSFQTTYTDIGFDELDKEKLISESKELELKDKEAKLKKEIELKLMEEKKKDAEKLKLLKEKEANKKPIVKDVKVIEPKTKKSSFEKELEFSKKIEEARKAAEESGKNPMAFDPLSVE